MLDHDSLNLAPDTKACGTYFYCIHRSLLRRKGGTWWCEGSQWAVCRWCTASGTQANPFPRSASAHRNYIIDGTWLRSIRDTEDSFPTLSFCKKTLYFWWQKVVQYPRYRRLLSYAQLMHIRNHNINGSVSDPGHLGIDPGSWIRDRYLKNQDPDHISESSETMFRVKNAKILWCGSGIFLTLDPGFKSWIQDPG